MASNTRSSSTRQSPSRPTHERASDRIRRVESISVDVPMIGEVHLPRPAHLAFYGGLGALAVLQLVEWPMALVLGIGHALSQDHHSRVAQELGAALDEA